MLMNSKVCVTCEEEKPISEFNILRGKYIQSSCKKCIALNTRNRYRTNEKYRKSIIEKNKLRASEYSRRYSRAHPELVKEINRIKYMLSYSGVRAELLEAASGKCQMCGDPILNKRGYAIHHKDGNRLNNNHENLLVTCTKCHLHGIHIPRRKY